MNRILATSALAIAMSSTAFAADMKPLTTVQMDVKSDFYATELTGMDVYATDQNVDATAGYNDETTKNWEEIGEVEDVILTKDGQVKAVIIGVGGFLDMGDHDVAVRMQDLHMVAREGGEDRRLVVNASEETLRNAAPFERRDDMRTDASTKTNTDAAMKAGNDDQMAKADGSATANTAFGSPDVESEGYREARADEITAETIQGADVYSSKTDEDIGEVNRLVMTQDGQVKEAIIDVGGFLGIGEHVIAVQPDEMRIMRSDEDDEVRVYINASQEELEARSEYKE